MSKTAEAQRRYRAGSESAAIKRAEKYAEQIESQITPAERVYDVSISTMLDTVPKRGSHLKVGQELAMSPAKVSDKQRKNWTLDDGSGNKVDLYEPVKITNIKSSGSTVTIFGEIRVARRQGVTTRTVKKRFNKSDRFDVIFER